MIELSIESVEWVTKARARELLGLTDGQIRSKIARRWTRGQHFAIIDGSTSVNMREEQLAPPPSLSYTLRAPLGRRGKVSLMRNAGVLSLRGLRQGLAIRGEMGIDSMGRERWRALRIRQEGYRHQPAHEHGHDDTSPGSIRQLRRNRPRTGLARLNLTFRHKAIFRALVWALTPRSMWNL